MRSWRIDPRINYVKLILSGRDGEIEMPWAAHVSDNLFRLGNMPFYAYGVSADDIVEATPTEHQGVVQLIGAGGERLRLRRWKFPALQGSAYFGYGGGAGACTSTGTFVEGGVGTPQAASRRSGLSER